MRRLEVPLNLRLDRLHLVLQAAIGWTNSHLWEIRVRDIGWGPPQSGWGLGGDLPLKASKASLLEVIEDTGAKAFKYLYDFGDGWEHTVKIERVGDPAPGLAYPRLIEAQGRCPPEDVGGPWGYAEFLEAIIDPGHERHAELTEWYGATQEAIELSRSNVQAEQLERLLDRSTDIPLVGRLVLGRYWRAAGDEQRQDYLALFRGYVLAGITRRLGGAKGIEKVEVTDSQPASGRDSMVATMITLGNGAAPSRVEWRVRQKGASYRIVDVVVEGVSLVVTNRDQFAAIVAESGMDGLLRELRDWSTRPAEQRPAA